MNNVIIPYSLAAVQERDHLVWDKVGQNPVILKRGTYKASEYDTERYTLPRSQVMCVREGKVLCAPLGFNGSAAVGAPLYYKISGLTYPATLSITLYKTTSSDGVKTVTVTGNDATALAASIKASDFNIVSSVVLDDGNIGVSMNSYDYSHDVDNAIYGRMRFRINDDNAERVTDLKVKIGNVTLEAFDTDAYQFDYYKSIFQKRGVAVLPNQTYLKRVGLDTAGWTGFHVDKMIDYYTASGATSFSTSGTMKKSVFEALAESEDPQEVAYYEKYNGDYRTYISRTLMDKDDVRSGNTVYKDMLAMTKIFAEAKTKDYNGNDTYGFRQVEKSATYGFDDPIHAVGNWQMADTLLATLIMERTGKNSSNKTEWDKEIILVGGTPTYAGTSFRLPCCESTRANCVVFYSTNGSYANGGAKTRSPSVLPFLAFDF